MMTFGRNPFARTERTRWIVYHDTHTCAWCGQVRKTRTGRAYLYRYGVQDDNMRTVCDAKTFCCLSCRDEYYS